jgi:hypothetical protein
MIEKTINLAGVEWLTENLTDKDGNDYVTYETAVNLVEELGFALPSEKAMWDLMRLPSMWDAELKGRWFADTEDDLKNPNMSLFLPAKGDKLYDDWIYDDVCIEVHTEVYWHFGNSYLRIYDGGIAMSYKLCDVSDRFCVRPILKSESVLNKKSEELLLGIDCSENYCSYKIGNTFCCCNLLQSSESKCLLFGELETEKVDTVTCLLRHPNCIKYAQ